MILTCLHSGPILGCCDMLLEFGNLFSLKNTILKMNVSGEL